MIEHLSIQNLILIEKAEISFGPGLNIITGETGSGKSAILTAIRLILGERAEIQWIRKGTDVAIVEATIRATMAIDDLVIPPTFIIRRELHRSGRSRCFIEEQQVTLQQLRALPIQLVDQAASLEERPLLDTYAELPIFAPHYQTLRAAKTKLEKLIQLQQTSQIEQRRMEEDLRFIEEINWQKGEEEPLQTEHNLLTHANELLEKTTNLTAFLSEELPKLKRLSYQIETLVKIEPKFQECTEWLKIGSLNLEEASHFLTSYASNLETDPNQLFAIEKRLGEIESIKRRFGSFEQMEQLKLRSLSNLDEAIAEAQKEFSLIEAAVLGEAAKRTETRSRAAVLFAKLILAELKSLNLPDARFAIDLQPKPLCEHGADEIRFLFAANPGQPLRTLDQSASGGELSRILFALKIALGNKEESSCLIFDEIDSNVGGQTAAILGTKLEQLATSRQLICVTHFVQVAKCAMDHFLVSKKTTDTGALTAIQKLDALARLQEYARMTGIL